MNKIHRFISYINNIQIYSALLWAVTIILGSYYHTSEFLSTILITAAGFHVVLMSQYNRPTKQDRAKNAC